MTPATALPLPTLLSQTVVAMTIELDNELEVRMPHFTGLGHKAGFPSSGPWLVSWAMWANFLRYVEPKGTPRDEVQRRARVTDADMRTALEGMTRWGYIGTGRYVKGGQWKKTPKDALVTLTPAGTAAQRFFRPLATTIEARWRDRFGAQAVDSLRAALRPLIDERLPAYLPIAHYGPGLRAQVPATGDATPEPREGDDELVALLARVLLRFTLDYESESELSLALAANFVRVLDGEGELVRDLPRLTGASKEAVTFGVGYLEKSGHAAVGPDSGAPKAKRARLTPKGAKAAVAHTARVAEIESAWQKRFGKADVTALRAVLAPLVGDATLASSPLAGGLVPPVGTWRTLVKPPETLPHHPLVLHRGCYPDGS